MAKVKRDAFLYLDPEPGVDDFAQCSSCFMWVYDDDRCVIHGPIVEVPGSASCGFYVYGDPQEPGTTTFYRVTPLESGLVDRDVRCENCRWGGPDSYTCELYTILNASLPEIFDLETHISPKGCCNANEPR